MLSKPMRGARPNRQHWSAKGLVGEWLFNEGCGTKAFDSSGNGNHGVLTNMASPATATSGWNAGRRGGGLRFDGSNDYVNCGNDSSFDITDAITIKMWLKKSPADERGFAYFTGKYSVWFIMFSSDLYQFRLNIDGWRGIPCGSDDPGNWHQIVMTRKGTKMVSYYDGYKAYTKVVPATTIATNAYPVYIGRLQYERYFTGHIDCLEIYARAKSAKEVAGDYLNEYARYQPRLTLAQLRYFVKLGVITDPSIESLRVNRTMKWKTIDRTIESLTPERTFNLGV